MEPAELAEALDIRLVRELSPSRAAHSRAVAALAAELCSRHAVDPARGFAAGLAHDLCKELPVATQRDLAASSGFLSPSSFLADKVVHGPAAAALLMRDYGVADDELLAAVAYHTVGRPGMGRLEIFVYCADKIEPGRHEVTQAFRDRCLSLEPRAMLLAVMESTMAYLREKGREIAPETLLLYNELRAIAPENRCQCDETALFR